MAYTLAALAQHLDAEIIGDAQLEVSSVATLADAKTGQISFLANSKYQQQLSQTKASAVIISPQAVDACPCAALVMKNPYVGYAKVAQLLDTTPKPADHIHVTAVIDDSAKLGANVCIGANAVIGKQVELGDNVIIGAGCVIGEHAKIGANTKLWANVTVYHSVIIGQDCLVQSGTVIGADGFGYANDKGIWHKIPQLGSVVIGNRVEIGASTTIDRGALGDTQIHDGVILDNQIQIAHNAIIGENTAIAGCTVIAGSAEIGKNCTLAGMVGVNGHLKVADGSMFTGMTMVTKEVTQAGVYSSGMPSQPNKEWHKMNARIKKLGDTMQRVKQLEQQIQQLTAALQQEQINKD